jgi:hypothetical protein
MAKSIEYLKSIAFRIAILKNTQEEFDLFFSRKFSPFQYIWLDENKMSDIFADLLNPNGDHGQKDAFLKLFLSKLSLEDKGGGLISPKVEREVITDKINNDKRRIDIVISWGKDFAIGIENKPWTNDGVEQLKDYSLQLNAKYSNYHLVYICEKEPSDHSISKEDKEQLQNQKNYTRIDYSNGIVDWLNDCINISQSDKIRHFIRDFKSEIKKYFSTMETGNTNEIVKYALSSSENLEAAFEAYNAFPKILETIAKNFSNKFIQRLKEIYGNEEIEISNETNGDRINVHFHKKAWIDGTFCSLKDHDKDRLYLSAFVQDESIKSGFHNYLKDEIKGRPNASQWWDYPSKFGHWIWSIEEVKLMDSNYAIDFFIEEFKKIITLIDQYSSIQKS